MLFRQPNVNFESNFTGNHNVVENEMNVDINMMANGGMPMEGGCMKEHKHHHHMNMGMAGNMNMCQEMPKEKCIHKTIVHEVPHVCPVHTRIINHHVMKHTYRPAYSCSEENVVSNVQCGSCNQYR